MVKINEVSMFFFKKNKLNRHPKNLDDINNAFETLAKSIQKGGFESSMIGKHIYENITNEKIRTLKVSAIHFEEFLTNFFEGRIVTKEDRKKIKEKITISSTADINRRVERNKFEKLDVIIGPIKISVKTLVPSNKELNIGSFSAEALFQGFLPYIPNERDALGSKALLKKQFQKIHDDGKWGDFEKRFIRMVEIIYTTDWIIGIKNDKYFDIYTLSAQEFRDLLISKIKKGPDEIITFINRFEAHALRTETAEIFKKAKHIRIKLLGETAKILYDLNEHLRKISSAVLRFLIGKIDKKKTKEEISEANKGIIGLIDK